MRSTKLAWLGKWGWADVWHHTHTIIYSPVFPFQSASGGGGGGVMIPKPRPMKIFLGEKWQKSWVKSSFAVFATVLNYNIQSPFILFLCCQAGNKSDHGQIWILIIIWGCLKNFEMLQNFSKIFSGFLISNALSKAASTDKSYLLCWVKRQEHTHQSPKA